MMSCGQTREFQNNRYENIDGSWYLVEQGEQKFAIIENTVTLKFGEGIDESRIKEFEKAHSLTFVRKSSAGWYDYEISEGSDIFEKCDAIMKSGIVAKVEIPTGGVYTGSSE